LWLFYSEKSDDNRGTHVQDPNPVKASLRKQKVAVIEKAGKVDVVAVDEA